MTSSVSNQKEFKYLQLGFPSPFPLNEQNVYKTKYFSVEMKKAEKDNRLLFGEQWMLLFSKSKVALFILSQSGAELRIQDGSAHKSRPRWKTAH